MKDKDLQSVLFDLIGELRNLTENNGKRIASLEFELNNQKRKFVEQQCFLDHLVTKTKKDEAILLANDFGDIYIYYTLKKNKYLTEPYIIRCILQNLQKSFLHDAKLKNGFVHSVDPEKDSEKCNKFETIKKVSWSD